MAMTTIETKKNKLIIIFILIIDKRMATARRFPDRTTFFIFGSAGK
jgi:hypothetical protein